MKKSLQCELGISFDMNEELSWGMEQRPLGNEYLDLVFPSEHALLLETRNEVAGLKDYDSPAIPQF